MSSGGVPGPDYARVFYVAPTPLLLLTPELTVVHANRAMVAATGATLVGSAGRPLFDDLPAGAGTSWSESRHVVRQSLERARDHRRVDTVPLQRYVVPTSDGRRRCGLRRPRESGAGVRRAG